MRVIRTIAVAAAGAAGALAFVLSCGDGGDTPRPDAAGTPVDAAHAADATTCDCPEPPQPIDQRVRRIRRDFSFPNTDTSLRISVYCDDEFGEGATVLGGGCLAPVNARGLGFVLVQDGPDGDRGFRCEWHKDPTSLDLPVHVDVICLVPEGTPPVDAGP